jgi:hypothetical protein
MPAYGLTLNGFRRKRLEDIREDLRGGMRAAFGEDLDLEPRSAFSKLIDPFAAQLDLAWQAAEGVSKSNDAQAAVGKSLENLFYPYIGGRLVATPSTVTVTAEDGTTYPQGSSFRASELGVDLISTESVTVGVSGTASIPLITLDTGPIQVGAGKIDALAGFVPGHISVTNASAATPGTDVEDDAAYRQRFEATRRALGHRLEDSIEASLLANPLIQYAAAVNNRGNRESDVWTNPTTGALLQPGELAVQIYPELTDPDELAAIAEILYREEPGGSPYAGDVEKLVIAANGREHSVKWSWVEAVELYVHLIILVGPDAPTNAGDQIAELVVSRGNLLEVSQDVVGFRLEAVGDEVRGVNNVAAFFSTTPTPTPSASDFAITANQIARFDLSRVTKSVVTS